MLPDIKPWGLAKVKEMTNAVYLQGQEVHWNTKLPSFYTYVPIAENKNFETVRLPYKEKLDNQRIYVRVDIQGWSKNM